jgi:hypothetical protein
MQVIHTIHRLKQLFTLKRSRKIADFTLKHSRLYAETLPRSIYTCICLYKKPVVSSRNQGITFLYQSNRSIIQQEKISMQLNLRLFSKNIYKVISSLRFRLLLNLILLFSMLISSQMAFAAADPLAGTEASLVATLGSNGTGRKFIYLFEGVAALVTYIKTKNWLMFGGVVAIAIFMEILFKVAGV